MILRNIFVQHVVRADDVLGAVCGYLLASEAWAHLFMLIEIFLPESFSVSPGFSADLDSWHGLSRCAELCQSQLADKHRFGYGSAGPSTRHHIDHAQSGVRAVLHCSRSRAAREREALTCVATRQLDPSLSAREITFTDLKATA